MSQWWLPAGTAIAAIVLTYLFCVRPMRREHRATTTTRPAPGNQDLDRALDSARAHLDRIRADAESGPAAPARTGAATRSSPRPQVLEEGQR